MDRSAITLLLLPLLYLISSIVTSIDKTRPFVLPVVRRAPRWIRGSEISSKRRDKYTKKKKTKEKNLSLSFSFLFSFSKRYRLIGETRVYVACVRRARGTRFTRGPHSTESCVPCTVTQYIDWGVDCAPPTDLPRLRTIRPSVYIPYWWAAATAYRILVTRSVSSARATHPTRYNRRIKTPCRSRPVCGT